MGSRPRLRPEPNQTDEIVELAGWVIIIILWGLSIYFYSSLPEKIPTHFNFAGQPDKWGNRKNFFVLPIVGTIVFIGLTVLNRYPYLFNYVVTITDENAMSQYDNATRMMRWFKISLGIIWCLIELFTYSLTRGKENLFRPWLLAIPAALILLPLVYFTRKSIRLNRKT